MVARLLTDILCSKHQSRQPLLPNNNNHNNRNNRNRNNHSNSNSRPAMVPLDRLPNLPNPLRKSVLNLRSLKSTYLSNSECRLRCRRRRVCHHSRCFRSRRRKRKRVRTRSRLLPNRKCKYMPNCKLKCRFKCKHKVRLRPRSVVYPLVRISRHHTIPGLRRLRQASVSHSKVLPLGLLSLLRTLV